MTSVMNILSTYGFDTTDCLNSWVALPWYANKETRVFGRGSWANGMLCSVTPLGGDRYAIDYHEWFDNGEHNYDHRETPVFHGGQTLGFIFEKVAPFSRKLNGR